MLAQTDQKLQCPQLSREKGMTRLARGTALAVLRRERCALTERQGMCARRNGPCGAFFMYTSERARRLPRTEPKASLDLVKNRRRVHFFSIPAETCENLGSLHKKSLGRVGHG